VRERGLRVLIPAASLGALLGYVYFGRFEPARTALWQIVSPAAAAGLVLLACVAAGDAVLAVSRRIMRLALGRPGDPSPAPLHEAVLVGLPALGTAVGAAAWAGLPLSASALLLALAGAGAGLLGLWRRRPIAAPRPNARDVLLLCPPLFLALLSAITPVASPDELIYKLAVPRQYLMWGRMVEMPLHSHSYFPAGSALAALPALVLSGGIAAKLLHYGAFLAALAALTKLARRLAPDGASWLTAVVAWTPALTIVAGWAWPDWIVLGLLLVSYEKWRSFLETGSGSDAASVAAALAGALACKYTALPWLAAFAPLALWQLRDGGRPRARLALAAAAILVLFGGFFYVRNLAWTGSPVAPFFQPSPPKVGHFRTPTMWGGWAGFLHGDDVFDPGIIDDSLGILLPLAALLSPLALAGERRKYRDLFAIGALQLVVFVTFSPLSRLLVTACVPLALLGAAALTDALAESPAATRRSLAAAAAVALAGQLALVGYTQVVGYDFLPYVVGTEKTEAYLLRTQGYARTYAWMSAHTPEESRILLLGETRSYYVDRPVVAGGNLDGPRIARYLARFNDPAAFGRELQRLGVTHLLWNRSRYRVGQGPATALEREVLLEVEPATDRMLREFVATRCKPAFTDGDFALYAVSP
jgi:hypothetical protein